MSLAHMSKLQAPHQIPEIWTLGELMLHLSDEDPEGSGRLIIFKAVAREIATACDWMIDDDCGDPNARTKWVLSARGVKSDNPRHRAPVEPYDAYTAHWAIPSWTGEVQTAKTNREASQAIKHALPWLEVALDRENRRASQRCRARADGVRGVVKHLIERFK